MHNANMKLLSRMFGMSVTGHGLRILQIIIIKSRLSSRCKVNYRENNESKQVDWVSISLVCEDNNSGFVIFNKVIISGTWIGNVIYIIT